MVLMLIAIGAGIVGALFGLGGGIIFIPVLTILFGLDAAEAVAASLVGIVATSTGSATGFVKKGLSNIRLGMLLEITTTIGAIIGAIIASYLENWILLILFSMVMLYSGFKMAVSPERTDIGEGRENELTFEYSDPASGVENRKYEVRNIRSGMALCTIAGAVSSMTGVGGGSIKVPLMNIYMHVPIKVASATSSYMIGITAFSGDHTPAGGGHRRHRSVYRSGHRDQDCRQDQRIRTQEVHVGGVLHNRIHHDSQSGGILVSLNSETAWILKAETSVGLVLMGAGLVLSIAGITDLLLLAGIVVLIFAPVMGVLVSTKCLVQEKDRTWLKVAVLLIIILAIGMLISYYK